MNRTKLFVRLIGLGEAHAEGIFGTLVFGGVVVSCFWILSRWDEGLFLLIAKGLGSVLEIVRLSYQHS